MTSLQIGSEVASAVVLESLGVVVLESASVEIGSSLLKTTADTISFNSRGGRGDKSSFFSTLSTPSSFSEISPLRTPEVEENDSSQTCRNCWPLKAGLVPSHLDPLLKEHFLKKIL